MFLQAINAALDEDQPIRAMILSLRLNEDSLIKKCIFSVNPVDIAGVIKSIPHRYLQRLVEALAELLESCPHLEFVLRWCQVVSFKIPICMAILSLSFSCRRSDSTQLTIFSLRNFAKLMVTTFNKIPEAYFLP